MNVEGNSVSKPIDPLYGLRVAKRRFVVLFFVVLFWNFASRILQPTHPTGGNVGLVSFCLALAFVAMAFRLSRALGNPIWKTIAFALLLFVPLINLLVVFFLIRKYAEVTGTKMNFLMFDSNSGASSAA